MNKIKENNNKKNNKKILVSILFLALTLFSILSPLMASKSDNIKVNALSAPTTKTLDLNGVRYQYQTSLNELKNKYGLFKYECDSTLFTLSNNSEGETILSYHCVGSTNEEEKESIATLTKSIFYFKNEKKEYINYNTEVNNDLANLTSIEFLEINNFSNISSIEIYFNKFNMLNKFNLESTNVQGDIFFYYVPDNFELNNASNYEEIQKQCKIIGYSFSNLTDFVFELPKFKGYLIQNIICSIKNDVITHPFNIFTNQFTSIINTTSNGNLGSALSVINNIKFLDNNFSNVITYEIKSIEDTIYPIFQGNILLSNTKADNKMLEFVHTHSIAPIYTISQTFDTRLYFGGYNSEKNPINKIYYHQIGNPVGAGGYRIDVDKTSTEEFPINKDVLYQYNAANDSIFSMYINYSNQNQLLYISDISNLRADIIADDFVGGTQSFEYEGAGLSAQVDNILYNVSLAGDVNQIEQDDDIKEDFINLLKTSALGTFVGLIIGLIAGAGPLGAVIGGSIGALIGIFPLIIDALQGVVGSSPALSTIYNLFKSVTMLFVDIFDAIINFALSFITNPIVLIIVVVAVLVYIFVIRKFKK